MSKLVVNQIEPQSGSTVTVVASNTLTVAGGIIAGGLTYPTSDGSANAVLSTNGSGTLSFVAINELVDDRVNNLFVAGEGIDFTYDDAGNSFTVTAETATASNLGVASFASADFSVSSGAVSLVDLTVSHFAAAAIVLESEGISSNDNDTTIPTSAAVKDYVDGQVATEDTIAEMNDTNISSPAAGHILIHDGSDSFDNKAVSGDITISSTGVTTIGAGAVDFAMISDTVDEDNMSSNSATKLPTQQSVKAYVDAEVTSAISGGTSTFVGATLNKDDNTVITEYQVTVADDGSGSQNHFYYDGAPAQQKLNLQAGETVRFILEDASVASHPFKLSITKDGTHNSGSEYTTGKTAVGTQGQSGAYVQLVVDAATADTLYPYCSSHSGMGGNSVFITGGYTNEDSISTLTNKTINASNNTLSNVTVAMMAGAAVTTESEGIASNDNDTSFPTSAAVKDFVDGQGFADVGLILALGG
tara:strand:- start:169 stop:1590 length:1422 start_codon:yes stop_codon:yes gene_type:complete